MGSVAALVGHRERISIGMVFREHFSISGPEKPGAGLDGGSFYSSRAQEL